MTSAKELTPEMLRPFVGGQIRIESPLIAVTQQGEIWEISISADIVCVKLRWLARLVGGVWHETTATTRAFSLRNSQFQMEGGLDAGAMTIDCPLSRDYFVLYPAGRLSNLSWAAVIKQPQTV